jgi:hypothetical protein
MGFTETVIFYCLVGFAVAVAVYLRQDASTVTERSFRVTTAVFFWPLFLPLLLARAPHEAPRPASSSNNSVDEIFQAIAQVDTELEAALSSLDGWAEDVLAREKDRIQELRSAWSGQSARIREMDHLLAQPEFRTNEHSECETDSLAALRDSEALTTHPSPESNDRRRQSEQARLKNIERLRQVRRQAYDDLMGTLAWVRELVSMIHLAKFTGAPASRAEELVTQIAAAVEGVSAVTWQEDVASV